MTLVETSLSAAVFSTRAAAAPFALMEDGVGEVALFEAATDAAAIAACSAAVSAVFLFASPLPTATASSECLRFFTFDDDVDFRGLLATALLGFFCGDFPVLSRSMTGAASGGCFFCGDGFFWRCASIIIGFCLCGRFNFCFSTMSVKPASGIRSGFIDGSGDGGGEGVFFADRRFVGERLLRCCCELEATPAAIFDREPEDNKKLMSSFKTDTFCVY